MERCHEKLNILTKVIYKYLATNYYVLIKLGNIMRIEILKFQFQHKRWLNDCINNYNEKFLVYSRSGITLRISCTVNLESVKTVFTETTELHELHVLMLLVNEQYKSKLKQCLNNHRIFVFKTQLQKIHVVTKNIVELKYIYVYIYIYIYTIYSI